MKKRADQGWPLAVEEQTAAGQQQVGGILGMWAAGIGEKEKGSEGENGRNYGKGLGEGLGEIHATSNREI